MVVGFVLRLVVGHVFSTPTEMIVATVKHVIPLKSIDKLSCRFGQNVQKGDETKR
jgi:hypothetical protein